MSLHIAPLEPKHVAALVMHPGAQVPPISLAEAEALANCGPAFAAVDHFGNVLGVAGLIPQNDCSALAWGLIAQGAARHLVAIHRATLRALEQAPFARVEVHVDAGFTKARRWAEMLGFRCETPEPMKYHAPGRRDAFMYARIKP